MMYFSDYTAEDYTSYSTSTTTRRTYQQCSDCCRTDRETEENAEMTKQQSQEAILNMCFKYHPTNNYSKLMNELKEVYDSFKFHDIFDDVKQCTELCYKLTKYIPKAITGDFNERLLTRQVKPIL
eukprot:1290041-Amphidinium_carterae.2